MAALEPVVDLNEITKYFNKKRILDRVSLQINRGEILGIVGPNGSGKSTLLKILLQLIKPSSGTVSFSSGESVRIGALLEKPGFYPDFTIEKNLRLFSLYQKKQADIDAVISDMHLQPYVNIKFKHCSTGIKRRAELASALLIHPQLLVLDEPLNGLDPSAIVELRSTLKAINGRGCSIIVTSHILNELEKICSRICFFSHGTIRECGEKETFLKKFFDLEDAYQYYTK